MLQQKFHINKAVWPQCCSSVALSPGKNAYHHNLCDDGYLVGTKPMATIHVAANVAIKIAFCCRLSQPAKGTEVQCGIRTTVTVSSCSCGNLPYSTHLHTIKSTQTINHVDTK
jgi:hypothetical protein